MKTTFKSTNTKHMLSLFAVFVLLEAQSLCGQWIRIDGPYEGTVQCFAVNGSQLFVGANPVFLSTNNGERWTTINTDLTYPDVYALAVDGSNLIIGTERGVFRATSNGTRWTSVNIGLTNTRVYSLAVNDSTLFAGTDNGLFLSDDNGASWLNVGLTNTIVYSLVMKGSHLFVGTFENGVFRSTNNGSSWIAINVGLTNILIRPLIMNESNLFAGTFGGGIFRSTNNGNNWTSINTGSSRTRVFSFALHGKNLFAAIDDSVFLSNDNGVSWREVNKGSGWRNVVISLATNDSYLFAGSLFGSLWRRPLLEMVTAVEENFNVAPVGFALEQNYPNPFNPSTQISFALPSAQKVTLKVFDLTGKEVATLLDNERKPAGVHEVIFEVGQLASGVYLYRVTAGEFVATRKMLLVR